MGCFPQVFLAVSLAPDSLVSYGDERDPDERNRLGVNVLPSFLRDRSLRISVAVRLAAVVALAPWLFRGCFFGNSFRQWLALSCLCVQAFFTPPPREV